MSESAFLKELEQLINKHSLENKSNTPDFILAEFLGKCLEGFNAAVKERSSWHGNKETYTSEGRPLEIGTEAGLAEPPTCCGGGCGCDKEMD